ncbi:hypothetical protein [Streptomyces lincolnensis]|uniref:hypothetical protein n=1 Tax=Streptomyces lincolnensis TaxID=1915 RepID=UPI0037D1B5E8
MQVKHFHCPECEPQLVMDSTPGICGSTIVYLDPGKRTKKCPGCQRKLSSHKRSHRR